MSVAAARGPAPGARLRFGDVELLFLPEAQFWTLVSTAARKA